MIGMIVGAFAGPPAAVRDAVASVINGDIVGMGLNLAGIFPVIGEVPGVARVAQNTPKAIARYPA